jgi:hypothetical protein
VTHDTTDSTPARVLCENNGDFFFLFYRERNDTCFDRENNAEITERGMYVCIRRMCALYELR